MLWVLSLWLRSQVRAWPVCHVDHAVITARQWNSESKCDFGARGTKLTETTRDSTKLVSLRKDSTTLVNGWQKGKDLRDRGEEKWGPCLGRNTGVTLHRQ